MKKLIALLAVLGFAPCAYSANGADFSHSGDFRLQYINDNTADGNEGDAKSDLNQAFVQRLRWGTTVRAGEKLSGHFTLVHNATWGMNTDQVPDSVDVSGTAASTNNLLIVNEAYGSWMVSDSWSMRFGRGSLTMADGRFVSTNEWEPVATAFEGVLASWDQEFARINFFGIKAAELAGLATTNSNDTNDDAVIWGVSADFKSLPDFLKQAHLHVLQINSDEATVGAGAINNSPKHNEMRIGAMIAGDMAGLDYRANYEMENGENELAGTKGDVKASMMDIELGYTLPAVMNLRIHANYHTDTGTDAAATTAGDDETYDGFHYDKHANAGLMDIFGWGNLTYLRAGFTLNPADDVTAGVDYLMFTQTEKDGDITTQSAGGGFATEDAAEDDLGTEIDVWAMKKYTNNFSITALYGMFSPGDEYKTAGNDDTYTRIYLEGKLTF